jgi:hypothetical protein
VTPYAIRLAGAPWPAFLSSRVLAGHADLALRVWRDIEVGLASDVVWLDDPARTGARTMGTLAGAGGFLDARMGAWQLDVRVGLLAPSSWMLDSPQINGFVGVGTAF